MAEPLTKETVAKVAHLARLKLSETELDLFTTQLGQVAANKQNAAVVSEMFSALFEKTKQRGAVFVKHRHINSTQHGAG